MNNKLTRSNGIIAGVCSSLASKFNISPWVIRVGFIVITIMYIFPIFAYILLWLVIPSKKYIIHGTPRSILYSKHLPLWYVLLNYTSLLGIIFWPIIFFGSIFIFDNPSNFFQAFITFILVNAYPLYLIMLIVLGFRIYYKQKFIAILLPILLLTIEGFIIRMFF